MAGGDQALHRAAREGHAEVARRLLDRGAAVDTTDGKLRTALMCAAQEGHEAVARLLLDRGAKVDRVTAGGSTALMFAAGMGHDAVARLLLDRGAKVDKATFDGWTALMIAVFEGSEPVMRVLLEYGATPGLEVAASGSVRASAPLSGVELARKWQDFDSLARLLLSYGASSSTYGGAPVPLVRECRAAVEAAVGGAGDRDVARLCGDYVSMVDRLRRVPGGA